MGKHLQKTDYFYRCNKKSELSIMRVINKLTQTIDAQVMVTFGKSRLQIRNLGINPEINIEIGEMTFSGTKEGCEQYRLYSEEEHKRTVDFFQRVGNVILSLWKFTPSGMETIRKEVDKMDDWNDHRRKNETVCISRDDFRNMQEELEELRNKVYGEETTTQEEDFEKVK